MASGTWLSLMVSSLSVFASATEVQGSLPHLDRRKMDINRANKQLWVRVYLVRSAASQSYVFQCMFGCIDQCIACWDSWLPGWEMDNVRNCGLKHNQTTPVSSAKQLWQETATSHGDCSSLCCGSGSATSPHHHHHHHVMIGYVMIDCLWLCAWPFAAIIVR